MNKEFRYVINDKPCSWQSCMMISVEKLQFNAIRLTNWYGTNWHIEYR